MKRSVLWFVMGLILILQSSVFAQDMLVRPDDAQNSLPQLQNSLRRPRSLPKALS